jgi:hypothetical protein
METNVNYRRRATLALAALVVASALIAWNDLGLQGSSYGHAQKLQLVSSPVTAKCVVDEWERANLTTVATRGIVIDTLLFIPSYVALLMALCFWYALRFAPQYADLRRLACALGWAALAAGILDLIENAGQLLEIHAHAFHVAPLTAGAAAAKWLIAAVVIVFICGVFLYEPLLFVSRLADEPGSSPTPADFPPKSA